MLDHMLVSGPSKEQMRAWLLTVRGITTDLGAEKELADAPDVLDCFFHWLHTGVIIPELVLPKHVFVPLSALHSRMVAPLGQCIAAGH